MRPLNALFLGCTLVALFTSVWLITSAYSHHEADRSIWSNVSDWSDALLAASPPTPQPDDIHSFKDPNNEKEEVEPEEVEEEEEDDEEQEDVDGNNNEPGDADSKLKKLRKTVTRAQKALEKYKAKHEIVQGMLDDITRRHRKASRRLIDREKALQEAIDRKKTEIDTTYDTIRMELLKAEYEDLKHDVVVPKSEIGPDGIEPRGSKILVLTAFDGGGSTSQSNISTTLMMNRNEYCSYHGYTHYFVNTSKYKADDELDRAPAWWKLPALQEAFETHPEVEWIWWMDADMIITNQLIDLAEHVLHPYVLSGRLTYGKPINDLGCHFSGQTYPSRDEVNVTNIDIIFSIDRLGINAGSFMIRRSFYTDLMLDIWQNPLFITSGFGLQEQDAYVHMYQNDPVVRNHTGFVSQRLFNSYTDYEVTEANWQHGDLAIHFAGKNRGEAHVKSWHEHFNQIVRVPEEYRLY